MKLAPNRSKAPPPELASIASRAYYLGATPHKAKRSWLGVPEPRRTRKTAADKDDTRQNASICPLVEDAEREEATRWVQDAIRLGQCRGPWEDGFPRYIWYKSEDGRYWAGRIMQPRQGDPPRAAYKGWPISETEWQTDYACGDRS